ncbi:wd40 repeat-like protein [Phaffia rhodozyma]|uniref:Eukaryotic translation initiation factor 3 subunit I n=1 Tax=Phaffia rhodozyma TaxID=264483 RepID=A0A0F7SN73_PHARH|nr:wd40 repeat-like protein [Phaffia rhodozyma]
MRPILLSGHERSLTQVIYNADGDLLFSCSKDHEINAWYSHNGERLGTYVGHKGAIWSVAVDSKSELLLSASADNCMKLWAVATGKCLFTWEFPTAVKRVSWNEDDSLFLSITEQRSGYQGAVRVHQINRENLTEQSVEPITEFNPIGSKATVAAFAPLSKNIITGHESGKVALFDVKSGEEVLSNEKAHAGTVTDLQLSNDGTYFVTSSKDKSARIHRTDDLLVLKTFPTNTPLNSASITPSRPYVILGGGQDAASVTTTSQRQGKFEARFWHRVFEEEVGRVRGHFGPLNTVAVHPSGKAFASGGEDGYIRLHWFDESYFRARPFGDLEPEE